MEFGDNILFYSLNIIHVFVVYPFFSSMFHVQPPMSLLFSLKHSGALRRTKIEPGSHLNISSSCVLRSQLLLLLT